MVNLEGTDTMIRVKPVPFCKMMEEHSSDGREAALGTASSVGAAICSMLAPSVAPGFSVANSLVHDILWLMNII